MKTHILIVIVSVFIAASCAQRRDDKGVVSANNDSIRKSTIGKIIKVTNSGLTEDSVMNHIAVTRKMLDHFRELVKGGKQREALDYYFKNNVDIAIALETSENIYRFDNEIIIPLIFSQCDSTEGFQKIVQVHEFDKFYIEALMIMKGAESSVPDIYLRTLADLSFAYLSTNEHSKALETSAKMLELLEKDQGRESLDYANSLYNHASIQIECKLYKEANSTLLEAKKIYEKLKMAGSKEYSNTLTRIKEIARG